MIMTNSSSASIANDIRDIKPPIEIYGGWEWFWWVLVAMALAGILLAALLFFLLRKKPRTVPPILPAHIRAKHKLEEALALIAQPKPFVIAVSDTARTYLEERFDFHAPERTTEEFLHELSGTDLLLPDQKESLGGFLESCDLVKFAKYEPGETNCVNCIRPRVRLVEETKPAEVIRRVQPVSAQCTVPQKSANASRKRKSKMVSLIHICCCCCCCCHCWRG